MNNDKRYVYICRYQAGNEERIVAFDNADALLDWENAVKENGGFIQESNKLKLWSGVVGYPSAETERYFYL